MLDKFNTHAFISFGLGFILMWLSEATEAHMNYTAKPRVVLPPNYVKEIRPPSKKGSPVIVDFSIFVVDINSINVEDMDFRVDMFIHQRWLESRLEIPDDIFEEGDDYVTLLPEVFENFWQPDPYFLNSKIAEIATLTHKFTSVTLYKNKTVRYAARMHAIIACQMEFQLYPMDIQVCPIYIESFSSNNQKVKLRWSDSGVTLNPELKLLQYNLGQPLELEESDGYMPEKVGNFSRLTVYFRFERQIGHHLIQTFAPSSLVVMLSWFSFWLGLDAIPGRVTLLVTCMLTLVTMFTGADIPPVAYVKALDLWMAGCMLSVFAALAEFVVVKVLDVQYQYQVNRIPKVLPMRISNMEKGQCATVASWEGGAVRSRKATQTPTTPGQTSLQGNGGPPKPARRQSLLSVAWTDTDTGVEKIMWREIDKVSRAVFPILFFVFVLLYWPILLMKSS
ncbi:glycine receptor subunit alpha-2 isoform X4 [Drosophila gunungcola]|uniref:Glycine receptor subunit alpha-2 n=2 Tax=melanogaster group TaxID=32346 RepID=A0ABM5HYG9_DRORH|nr:glycine receptor subunit alpha-2 isoform X1 [Drosophila rhopaloa]XP_016987240.2 glycine receptor subunit alpha-2 isoform X1 [Drosophila rhopaloa]XP_016987241.2 glycine receptor subunit alpha-2 isoform X1 [Drosophila rhopaloa]XP_017123533.1 glycine receptor subunit alpha-2 isoform X1 [Drosophila elegans]XP_017123534.1 glycine receptor subunit alpha-2 isoform X1 [Drosophila elegans]XP_017123535.1 glycine receptor subunit alpha-2 isoform X1 [Drosophila elegans]XP_041563383.1 glycine receptor 